MSHPGCPRRCYLREQQPCMILREKFTRGEYTLGEYLDRISKWPSSNRRFTQYCSHSVRCIIGASLSEPQTELEIPEQRFDCCERGPCNRRRGEEQLTAFVQADSTTDGISPRTKYSNGEITQSLATLQGMLEHAQSHGGHPRSFHLFFTSPKETPL